MERMGAQYGADPRERQGAESGVRIGGQHEANWETASFGGRELSGTGIHNLYFMRSSSLPTQGVSPECEFDGSPQHGQTVAVFRHLLGRAL